MKTENKMTESRFKFSYPIKVRHADTDAQGHVFFGNYFTFFDEAVTGYLEAIGLPYKTFSELGVDFFYVDAHCQYKSSAVSGELLQADARVEKIGNTSVIFECAIYRQGSDQKIAGGHVTAVMVNPKTRQPVRVPDKIRQAIMNFEQADR
jgi:acyl-CoA thioester hydrolase